MVRLNYDSKKFEEMCNRNKLLLVVLHGSYSNGITTDKSDIDVAFLGEPEIVRKKYYDIIGDFTDVFGEKVDPVCLNSAEAMITYQVAINGTLLYEIRKGLFEEFKLGAYSRYMDTKKFRDLEKQYIKSIVKEDR